MNTANKNINARAVPSTVRSLPPFWALFFVALCLLPFALAWDLTRSLSALVLTNDTFSHIPLIPLVSAYLIYVNRKAIFCDISFEPVAGGSVLVLGIIFVIVARFNIQQFQPTNREALFVLGIACIWVGSFIALFGARAFRSACFPLLFLLFAVPIPEPLLSSVIASLQKGSADFAELFLKLAGVPYLRHELVFDLPGVSIRVAEECSGIRSTLALLITTSLASYLFLKTGWRRMLLILAVVPLAVMKNGLRIATLTLLSIYVDPGFLTGDLHRRGGIVFFIIALVPMALLLILLERGERPRRPQSDERLVRGQA